MQVKIQVWSWTLRRFRGTGNFRKPDRVQPCKPHLPRGRYPTADKWRLRLQGEFQNGSHALQGAFANAEHGRRNAVKRNRAVHYPHSPEQAGRAQLARQGILRFCLSRSRLTKKEGARVSTAAPSMRVFFQRPFLTVKTGILRKINATPNLTSGGNGNDSERYRAFPNKLGQNSRN